jgi:hypothetical protein
VPLEVRAIPGTAVNVKHPPAGPDNAILIKTDFIGERRQTVGKREGRERGPRRAQANLAGRIRMRI